MHLRTIFILLKLPADLLWVIVRYYLVGGLRFRKFRNSLLNCLKLKVYRTALTVDMMDARYLGPWTNSFLLRKLVPLTIGPLVRSMPAYGEQYDEQGIWLAKAPNRTVADPVIIYAHGGGYFVQTMAEQVQLVCALYKMLHPDKQRRTLLLFLDYKLVSQGYPFPTQINQLDAMYLRLVAEGNTNIVLLGDSAGGNLSIGYTQLLRQREVAGQRVVYPTKLLLMLPWVKLAPLPNDLVAGRLWIDNEHYDIIHHLLFTLLKDLARLVGHEDPMSLVFSPGGKVPKQRSDWSLIPCYSDPDYDVFLILGEDELFRDEILEWAQYALDVDLFQRVKYGNSHVELKKENYEVQRRDVQGQALLALHIEPWGVHDLVLFFENLAARVISAAIKRGDKVSLDDFDDVMYFGLRRMAAFLNERL